MEELSDAVAYGLPLNDCSKLWGMTYESVRHDNHLTGECLIPKQRIFNFSTLR